MVRDNDQLKGLQGEKRTLDSLSVTTERMVRAFRYGERGETSAQVARLESRREREITSRLIIRTTMSSGLGLQIDECENQDPKQNPNGDASSPSLCPVESKRRRQVVSNKAVGRRKPVREREVVIERDAVRERRTPEWLVNVMREKNGVDAKLIIEKNLKISDLSRHLARLLIPFNQIEDMDFLNEKELEIIDDHFNKIRDKGVDVTLVDSRGQQWELNLKRWDFYTTSNYVLGKEWNKVVSHNRLEINQKIRLWSFHSPDKLFVALVPPDQAPAPAPALAPALALPLVPDPAPSLHPAPALAPDPALAMALVPDPTPSLHPAPVVTRDSEQLYISQLPLKKRIYLRA